MLSPPCLDAEIDWGYSHPHILNELRWVLGTFFITDMYRIIVQLLLIYLINFYCLLSVCPYTIYHFWYSAAQSGIIQFQKFSLLFLYFHKRWTSILFSSWSYVVFRQVNYCLTALYLNSGIKVFLTQIVNHSLLDSSEKNDWRP